MHPLQFDNIPLQLLVEPKSLNNNILLSVLRLDKIHPIISGNKWFKLQHYLKDALQKGYTTIATFGGAYSNHIAATAFACKEYKLKSVGIIRGEAPKQLSHTLKAATNYGMELQFINRALYKNKTDIKEKYNNNFYWIDEGGYGLLGCKGAATIGAFIPTDATHILCAIGTGTTFAGLIKQALPHQIIIGINVLKGNESITEEVNALLLTEEKSRPFYLLNDYHFGGYAKHPVELINYMKQLWEQYQLPTDIVYTSKLMYAVFDLLNKNYFPASSKIIAIHSGGLQGNLSLPKNTLPF